MVQVLKVTEGPYAAAPVVLDLSPGGSGWQLGDEYDFSPPPVALRTADTPLDDGEQVIDATYGNRQVELKLTMPVQASAAARAAANTALAEAIGRDRYWLEVRPDGASASRWLRCYRYADAQLLARLGQGRYWAELPQLRLVADPFALAERTSVDVSLNPATLAVATAAAVAGDVPTPALVQRIGVGGLNNLGTAWIAARRRRVHTANPPDSILADTLTAGVDGSSVADALAYGGSRIDITYATRTDLSNPLSGSTFRASIASANVLNPARTDQRNRGTYKVFVRMGASAAQTVQLRMYRGAVYGPVVQRVLGTALAWIDTGFLVQFPVQDSPVSKGYGDATLTPVGGDGLQIDTGRVAGTGNTRIDTFALMPADDALAYTYADPGTGAVVSTDGYFDPINGKAWVEGASGAMPVLTGGASHWIGGLPVLDPVFQTDLWGVYQVPISGSAETVRLHYWPRYLSVV